jgi:hypothetical protein
MQAMEILEGDALYRVLLQSYSKDPRGWSFTISPSSGDGFFDARVGGPDESWHLKLDTIYKASPFVLGAKTDQDLSRSSPAPLSFGFRRVSPQEAPALLDDSHEGLDRLLAFLSAADPVAPTVPGDYIRGPYVFASRGKATGSLTREQQSVDSRLSDEMRKLVRRRYPGYL